MAFRPFYFRLCITEVTENLEITEKSINAENTENTEDAEGFLLRTKYLLNLKF